MMSWQDQLQADCLPWLLEPQSPGVRYLALRDLLAVADDDPELGTARQAAHREGPIAAVLAEMDGAGYWAEPGPGYLPKYRSTVWSLILLAQLGAHVAEDERVGRACEYVLDHALAAGGQFSMSGAPSGTIDCLQGNLCASLLDLGCRDARLEAAFDWMARTVTGEGIAPAEERSAPARYYAAKCGPRFACGANNTLPCAWGAAKVLLALGRWPAEGRTPAMQEAIRVGIDFFLSVDPATAAYPAGYSDKPSSNWWKLGFPVFYVSDVLQIVEALAAVGAGADPRLASALAVVRDKQDRVGRWLLEYDYAGKTWVDFGPKKAPNKWVTLRALRALKAVAEQTGG